ncbi:hypothetical protein EGR_03673 [Echinococcus granulosus]|uniref:Uncharacterized protein n=1 Tax=Echinococcus granulosus TaxID=6210 RepID=W6UJY8_ECHGR|nr:hypothetical protein EGR_03673 [Echinococcus granulosus]EUB61383.1 hypothetical protein EGR_03673 [Echinococcus granulosus]
MDEQVCGLDSIVPPPSYVGKRKREEEEGEKEEEEEEEEEREIKIGLNEQDERLLSN